MAAGQRPAWVHAAWAFCPSHSALGMIAKGNSCSSRLLLVPRLQCCRSSFNFKDASIIALLTALACSEACMSSMMM